MDEQRFDQLTRALAHGRSRRSVLTGLLGIGGAAAIFTSSVEKATARRRGGVTTPTTTTEAPTTTTAAPTCDGYPCGLDCCGSDLQCCDGECCAEGYTCLTQVFPEGPFVSEEVCCRDDLVCYTETSKCCSASEQCCNREGQQVCIPLDSCCTGDQCPLAAECQVGVCQDGACLSHDDCRADPENCCSGCQSCDSATGTCFDDVNNCMEFPNSFCIEGECECTPQCDGSACIDGCGGTCECPEGRICLSNGTCAISCGSGGSDCFSLCGEGGCSMEADGSFVCWNPGFFGNCSSNPDCVVGMACFGTTCRHVC